MSSFWGRGELPRVCLSISLFFLVNDGVLAVDITPPPVFGEPSHIQRGTPVLDIPLPEEGAEEEAFKGYKIPPKQERIPDERTIEVRQFNVSRLIPKEADSEVCIEDATGQFCVLPVNDPDLDQLLQTAIAEYQSQFSIFDLEDIALRVTNFFRSRDLILDTAFIPPQDVAEASVEIHVLQGRLGNVTVKGNETYKASVLLAPFDDLIGQPVTRREITHSLLTVWDYPRLALADRKAQLTFFPGDEVGETSLEMEIYEQERAYNLSLSLDNAGSEYSGIYRGGLSVDFNNPTGSADQLSFTLLGNADPANGTYYFAEYLRPIFSPFFKLRLGVSRNDFELSQQFEDFTGVTDQAYIGLETVFMQSFRERFTGGVTFTRKNADTELDDEKIAEDKLAVLAFDIDYLFTDEWLASKGANQTRFFADYAHGFGNFLGSMDSTNPTDDPPSSRTLNNGDQAGAKFDKLDIGFIRKQQFIADTSIWFRLNGQYSPDALVALEMMSMGGPNSVRAYPTAEILKDKGYFASIEWSSQLPFLREASVPGWLSGGRDATWGRAISVSLFADYAEGWLNYPVDLSQEESEDLDGYGIGMSFQTARVNLNMSLATPFSDREASNGDDPQFFANLWIQFF